MEFNYKDEIKLNLLKRQSNNPSYSLRAYSRDLDVSLTALSSLLAGKRNLSIKNAIKVAEKLSFSPLQTKLMLQSLSEKNIVGLIKDNDLLKEDEFNLIANWYCMALLTLIRNNKTRNNSKKLAKKFGIQEQQIKEALGLLKRLNFIEIKDGLIKRRVKDLTTSNDIPSEALRKYHKSNLQLAQKNLEETHVSERHIVNVSLTCSQDELAKAKKLIDAFKQNFDKKIDSKSKDQVYNLSIQFFPAKDFQPRTLK